MKTLDPGHILTKIVTAKRERLQRQKRMVPEVIVRDMARRSPEPKSFRLAIDGQPGIRIIAEIKKASPSKGVLDATLDVPALATAYAANGAAAISVVTEQDFFQGDLAWVRTVNQITTLPVLRKDFVFDRYQLFETRAVGASAVLLIAAMLLPDELKELLQGATEAGLDPLVEVHDDQELDEALSAGATLIGVNNRSLKTFDVQLETSLRLSSRIPDDIVFVCESGIRTRDDIERLRAVGADAFLVGEHLVTSGDPGAALRELQ